MSRLPKALALGSIVAIGGALAIALAPWVDVEQDLGLSWLYRARGPIRPPGEVVIVAIDEESVQKLGMSDKPRSWPRALHAELVRYLAQAGARVIVLDLTFDTPSPQPEQDAQFSAAIGAAGNVFVSDSMHKDTLPLHDSAGQPVASMVIERPTLPIPIVEQAVAGHAPFVVPKASRVDAYWAFRGGAADAPTLPVLAFQFYAPDVRRSTGETSYLNLYGPARTIRTVPYSRVLEGARREADPADPNALNARMFNGTAVFVGVSAVSPGGQDRLRDDYRTVFSQANGLDLSGVELAATAFANLLEDRPLRPAKTAWQFAIVFAWAVVLAVVCRSLRPTRAVAVAGVLAALYLWLVYDRFAAEAWWWPSVVPIGVQIPLALFAGIWLYYRDTKREREAIKQAFGYFLPSTMVDQLAHDIGSMTQTNRVAFGSCLATDVGRYTTLAEHMDPGRLGQLMNEYFAQLFVPVERSGGAVVDVVGDAMVAVWAASSSNAQLRRNACEAALDIVAAVDRFNHAVVGRPSLPTRLGLHSGDMLIGNIGASRHYEYRAVGDIVNTASRLQGLNKPLGTQLLASAATVDGLDGLATRPLGSFVLAGKADALSVVELLGPPSKVSAAQARLCEQFARALASYQSRQWRAAADQFSQILSEAPDDGPSRFYLARCDELLVNPPDETWNPTIAMDTA